jgi:DNA-binding transcriptional ArsR family regulator
MRKVHAPKPWVRFPTTWIREAKGLREITWKEHRSAGIAALMIWVALAFKAERVQLQPTNVWRAAVSYSTLEDMTGLSRATISKGLALLKEKLMVLVSEVQGQTTEYMLPVILNGGWCQLPCRALSHITPSGQAYHIPSFRNHFKLRSKHELNALKMYLLLAAVRDNKTEYAMCSYETINEYTGIAEKDIATAHSFLIAAGLFARVEKEHSATAKVNEPNKYYLMGYRDMFREVRSVTTNPDGTVTKTERSSL